MHIYVTNITHIPITYMCCIHRHIYVLIHPYHIYVLYTPSHICAHTTFI